MALINGDDATGNLAFGNAAYNRFKNHFRGAAVSNPQPGSIQSITVNERLIHRQAAVSKYILQETDCMLYVDAKLASSLAVNMNPGAPPAMTVLYTVPAGKSCIITKVVIRNSSGNLTTASISFGFDVNGSDVIANGTRTYLNDSTKYGVIPPINGAVRGAAAGTFKVAVNTAQGGAMTIDIDVFGYLF